jgi:hypothetical protein
MFCPHTMTAAQMQSMQKQKQVCDDTERKLVIKVFSKQ